MLKKIIFPFCIYLIIGLNCKAQNLLIAKRTSPFTYLYPLNNDVARLVYQHQNAKDFLPPFLEKMAPIDSLCTDSIAYIENLLHNQPYGYYVYVSAYENKLEYRILHKNSFHYRLFYNKSKLYLQLYDQKNLEILQADEVWVGKKKINYDALVKAYEMKIFKKNKFLTIKKNNEYQFLYINKFKEVRNNYDWDSGYSQNYLFNNSRNKANGYLVLNKPKYLPGDSVKLKAFLVNKRGKGLKKDLELYFKSDYDSRVKLTSLKAISPGAYTYSFKLADSLIINRDYRLDLMDKKGNFIFSSHSLRLEDYQLKENTYSFASQKQDYLKGEKVSFFASGKNSSGLNVLDGKIYLIAKVNYFKSFAPERLFIPNVLWQDTLDLETTGDTKICIPDSLLPDAFMNITVTATFLNSNNEAIMRSSTFNYNYDNRHVKLELQGSNLSAQLLKGDVELTEAGILIKEYADKAAQNKRINFPYTEPIDPFVKQYIILTQDTMMKSLDLENLPRVNEQIQIKGIKTADSIRVRVENPNQLFFTYSIYKNKTLVECATAKELNWSKANKSLAAFTVYCQYYFGGKLRTITKVISPYEKSLQVKIEQPAVVSPGDNIPVKIKVKDFYDKPVKDVNLTALAINSQFTENNIPALPYLGQHHPGIAIKQKKEIEKEFYFEKSNLELTRNWRKRMRIDSLPFYKMLYPPNGIHYNSDSTQQNYAEFAPFLMSNGNVQSIFKIDLDNQPVYHYRETAPSGRFSFVTNEGFHQIKLRTYNKLYVLDSIYLPAGIKTDLSIDLNNLPKNVKVFERPTYFTEFEFQQIKNSSFFLQIDRGQETYVWQNNKVFYFPASYYAPNVSHTRVNVFGLFAAPLNVAALNTFNQCLTFEPGYTYTVTSGLIKKQCSFENYYKQGFYNFSYNKNSMGEKALSPNEIVLETKVISNKTVFDFIDNYEITKEGNGSIYYEYKGDSTFISIQLSKLTGDYKDVYYRTQNAGKLHNLSPGTYRLTCYTNNLNYFIIDSFTVKPNGVSCVKLTGNFSDGKLRTSLNTGYQSKLKNEPVLKRMNTYIYGNITVSLKDETGEPVLGASVYLKSDNGQEYNGISGIDGKAKLNAPPGKYELRVLFLGFKPITMKNCEIRGDYNKNLELTLKEETVSLNEVVVTSSIGKSIFNSKQKEENIYMDDQFDRVFGGNAVLSLSEKSSWVAAIKTKYRGSHTIELDRDLEMNDSMVANNNKKHQENKGNIRKNFIDNAYWQGNLLTDKNGEASFIAKFPDNITSWNSFALAMDEKKHSGSGFTVTHAFKQVLGNLACPRFLVEGDQSYVIGKALNYSDKSILAKSSFTIENKLVHEKDTLLKDLIVRKYLVIAPDKDSVKMCYTIEQTEGKVKDGEERSIPVFKRGTLETKGSFYVLEKDETIQLNLNPENNTEIYAQSNSLDLLLKELDDLKKYPYACMEQTASKLNACLMEEQIRKFKQENFSNKDEINRLINRLKKGQKPNGAWGWWENSKENVWMTCYVSGTLQKAVKAGYIFNQMQKALEYIQSRLPYLAGEELLYALQFLSAQSIPLAYKEYVEKLENEYAVKTYRMNLYEQFKLIQLKQQAGLPYSLDSLLNTKKSTLYGSIYWGAEINHWYNCTNELTQLAYKILQKQDSTHSDLPFIRNYFLEKRNSNGWQNTFHTAGIIETILPGFMREKKNYVPVKLELSGDINERIEQFPYHKKLNGAARITVKKTGTSTVYFSAYERRWNKQPEANSNYFVISSRFIKDNKSINQLQAGTNVDLEVEIEVKNSANYVLIEIPIPAACSYNENKRESNNYESHRELFKHKTNIYCEYLPQGKHIFRVPLEVRYSGVYCLNPVKIEDMYFPVLFGRNRMQELKVKD